MKLTIFVLLAVLALASAGVLPRVARQAVIERTVITKSGPGFGRPGFGYGPGYGSGSVYGPGGHFGGPGYGAGPGYGPGPGYTGFRPPIGPSTVVKTTVIRHG